MILDLLQYFLDAFCNFPKSITNRPQIWTLGPYICHQKIQKSTRQVQIICTHGKNIVKNMSLASLIPAVKRALETFVYKINSLFVSMGHTNVVTVGNLKTKGLDGKEVQVESSGSEEEEEDEDEEEEEEEEVEVAWTFHDDAEAGAEACTCPALACASRY